MITYSWHYSSVTGGPVDLSSGFYDLPSITFSDAAVQAGSYSANNCGFAVFGNCTHAGDISQVNNLGFNDFIAYYSWNINVSFNSDGTLTGSISWNNDSKDYHSTGDHLAWSGDMNSDRLNCYPDRCSMTGFWHTSTSPVPVPEPGSAVLLLTTLIVCTALRLKCEKTF